MERESLILTIISIHFLALILPGPDLIMIIKTSLSSSKKTGIYMAIGSSLGVLFHVSYSLLGLGIILSKTLLLFGIIKILGAMYLIYFGLNLFISKLELEKELQENTIIIQREISFLEAIKIGFLSNILNPKAILFFLSLFTMLMNEGQNILVIFTSSYLIILNNFLWFSFIAITMDNEKIRILYEKIQTKLNKIFGTILIVFGIKFISITK